MFHIRYTEEQRRFILMTWIQLKQLHRTDEKYRKLKEEFILKYPEAAIRSRSTVFRMQAKFQSTSSVNNRKKKRGKTATCEENVRIIK